MAFDLRLLSASVSLLAISTLSSAASAQTGAGAEGLNNDEIVVSARRREESAQDVPLVVQAVTAEKLQKLNIRNFEEVQSLVPGLSLARGPGGTATQSTLRGIAFDVNASGANGTIEFYFNDASIISNILFQSMFDVGQIEVLRGPQGTLRGRASPSGSITVTSHKPDLSQAGGYLTVTANDLGGWNGNAAINVPIIADKLGIRVAGILSDSDADEVRSLYNSRKPLDRTEGLRATVAAEPFDFLSLNFNYTVTHRRYNTFDQVESANIADPTVAASPFLIEGKDRLSVMTVPRPTEQTFKVYNWSAELRQFGQKLNYVGSHTSQHYLAFAPADLGGFFGLAFPEQIRNAGQSTDTPNISTNHEIRLSSDERIAGIFDYVVGYYHSVLESKSALVSDTLIFSASPPTPTNLLVDLKTPVNRNALNREESFFGNITAHLPTGTEISAGARRIKFHSEGALIISGVPVAAAAENRTFHTTIFQASVKQRLNENLMAYASFGTSWRPGSATNAIIFRDNTTPTAAEAGLYFPPPEKSKSFEVGFKSDWLDRRLRINVTAFHQTFKNFAFSSRSLFFGGRRAGSPTDEVFTANPAIAVGVPAKVDGVEAEIQFQPSERFSVGVVASYSKSKIRNGTIPCNDYFKPDGTLGADGIPDSISKQPSFAQLNQLTGGTNNAAGLPVTYGKLVQFCQTGIRAGTSAPFSASVTSEYSVPVMPNMEGYLRGLLTYNGNSLNDPTNAFDNIKSYGILNLYAGIRRPDSGWDLTFYAKNVFDSQRALLRGANVLTTPFRAPASTPVAQATPWRSVTYTAPREFGVNLRVAFGSR